MRGDPFGPLAPLLAAAAGAPLSPVLTILGDDEWFVAEASQRVAKAFREAFPEGEVSEYEGTGNGVREAVADAATIALFSTNRLVALDVTDLLRTKKLTADEVDSLLDEAADAGLGAAPGAPSEPRVLDRLARKARALARDAGALVEGDAAETARKVTGRVRRSDRAPELAQLLSLPVDDGEAAETALGRLLEYATRARPVGALPLMHEAHAEPQPMAGAVDAKNAHLYPIPRLNHFRSASGRDGSPAARSGRPSGRRPAGASTRSKRRSWRHASPAGSSTPGSRA